MKYLVLYEDEVRISGGNFEYMNSRADWSECVGSAEIDVPTWRVFDNKKEAVEFAVENVGVIVEAFSFDITKTPAEAKRKPQPHSDNKKARKD